jgi:predicted nucleotidyltransferase
MDHEAAPHLRLARRVADQFAPLPEVEAIALAGSLAAGTGDAGSDVDLYVYITSEITLEERVAIVDRLASRDLELDLQFWDPSDAWYDEETGIEVDVIYWRPAWIEAQLDRVLVECQANLGCSTCFWHTVRNSRILYDRNGWFQRLQTRSAVPFPPALRQAIVAKNHPVLRRAIPSYLHQIEKALGRNDLVSLNHRVAALLASYFDVLFALNRLPHPGEKRLLQTASAVCASLPRDMVHQVEAVLRAACRPDPDLVFRIAVLVDGLDQLLLEEGFDPRTSLPLAR